MVPFPDGTVFLVLDADVLSKFTILVGLYGNFMGMYALDMRGRHHISKDMFDESQLKRGCSYKHRIYVPSGFDRSGDFFMYDFLKK